MSFASDVALRTDRHEHRLAVTRELQVAGEVTATDGRQLRDHTSGPRRLAINRSCTRTARPVGSATYSHCGLSRGRTGSRTAAAGPAQHIGARELAIGAHAQHFDAARVGLDEEDVAVGARCISRGPCSPSLANVST